MTSNALSMAAHFSERFNSQRERSLATHDLAAMGPAAIPVLEAILSGAAKNPLGVAYRDLGQPLMLSFVTIRLLGSAARGLEQILDTQPPPSWALVNNAYRIGTVLKW